MSELFPPLKRLLNRSNKNVVSDAVLLFDNFASLSVQIKDAIGECGAIEKLIELLFSKEHPASNIDLCRRIVVTLSNIADGNEKNQTRILDSGHIADWVRLMRNEQLRGPTVDAVSNYCKENYRSQRAFKEAGAITTLAALLAESHANPAAGQRDTIAQALVQALGTIVEENPANQQAARLAGCIPQILQFMTNSESEWVRSATADTIECLFYGCPENKAEVLKHGGVA
eukprot:gene34992-45291_t